MNNNSQKLLQSFWRICCLHPHSAQPLGPLAETQTHQTQISFAFTVLLTWTASHIYLWDRLSHLLRSLLRCHLISEDFCPFLHILPLCLPASDIVYIHLFICLASLATPPTQAHRSISFALFIAGSPELKNKYWLSDWPNGWTCVLVIIPWVDRNRYSLKQYQAKGICLKRKDSSRNPRIAMTIGSLVGLGWVSWRQELEKVARPQWKGWEDLNSGIPSWPHFTSPLPGDSWFPSHFSWYHPTWQLWLCIYCPTPSALSVSFSMEESDDLRSPFQPKSTVPKLLASQLVKPMSSPEPLT